MSSEWVKYTSVLTWQTKPVYVHRNAAGQTNTGLAAWLLSHEGRHHVPLHDRSPAVDYGHLRRLSAHERRLQNPNSTHNNRRTHAYVAVLGRLVLLACEPKEAFQNDVRATQTQTNGGLFVKQTYSSRSRSCRGPSSR